MQGFDSFAAFDMLLINILRTVHRMQTTDAQKAAPKSQLQSRQARTFSEATPARRTKGCAESAAAKPTRADVLRGHAGAEAAKPTRAHVLCGHAGTAHRNKRLGCAVCVTILLEQMVVV